jgi:hypothetical protein
MKLINRLTLWYLAITTIVLLASGLIVFYFVQLGIENEVTRRLKRDLDNAARLLDTKVPVDSLKAMQFGVSELPFDAPPIKMQVTDSMG